jgi:hypothetical protein
MTIPYLETYTLTIEQKNVFVYTLMQQISHNYIYFLNYWLCKILPPQNLNIIQSNSVGYCTVVILSKC